MAKTADYYTPLDSNYFYHVYNRTVNGERLFINRGNYEFFLKQYDKYLSAYVETYAYCLLNNHFHLLIRVKTWENILAYFQDLESRKIDLTTFGKLSNLNDKKISSVISHQFQLFFQSYAMAFNKQQGRYGTLFQTPFKRSLIETDNYLTQMIFYIHTNPQKHGLVSDFREYFWSSYQGMLIDSPTKLYKKEVLEWFGDKLAYIQFHLENPNLDNIKNIVIDAE